MLERFIERYSERAFQFAYKLCGNVAEAQELVQEAFFRVIKNWDCYDHNQSFESWYLTILKNVHADAVKRHDRRWGMSLDFLVLGDGEPMTLADALPDSREESLLSRLERRETDDMVRGVLEGLSVRHKAILTLCEMEGLGYEEIARVLNLPLGTVRSRINRARAVFKERLLEVMEDANYAVS